MGQTDDLNKPQPPKLLERVVGLAIPKASREYVLGDLHERSDPFSFDARAMQLPFNRAFSECFRLVLVVADLVATIFSASLVAYFVRPILSIFPTALITFHSARVVTALLLPLRIWLAVRKRGRELRA